MTIISIFNMKGGVAKSTTAYNLAVGLTQFHGKRVLAIDVDPQGHCGVGLGIKVWDLTVQIKDVFQGHVAAEKALVKTASGVDILPSNLLLSDEEIPLSGRHGRELLLRRAIAPIAKNYDLILIDCPPNVGVFSVNALMAAQSVIIPVDMSYLGLLGVRSIIRTLELVRESLEHPIEIHGVLATRFDGRNNISGEVLGSLSARFGEAMFKTIIPENVKLREAPSFGQSIFEYAPRSTGAKAYEDLTQEVIDRG